MTYNFENDKANHLTKLKTLDKSRKGSIDDRILSLIKAMNAHPDLFTTSSCAGRLRILETWPEARKNQVHWTWVSHEPINQRIAKELWMKLQKQSKTLTKEKELWFFQESAIVHVATRTLEDAQKIVNLAREAGFKRSGIQSFTRRHIVELVNNDRIEMPLFLQQQWIINEQSFLLLIKRANLKLRRNFQKITILEKKIKEWNKEKKKERKK